MVDKLFFRKRRLEQKDFILFLRLTFPLPISVILMIKLTLLLLIISYWVLLIIF